MGHERFTTTDANSVAGNQGGQSVLEFLLLLPLLLGFAGLMVRMNQAIQVSIVNQKYARAQALFLTMNNREYPALYQRVPNLTASGYNQMFLGVSENPAPDANSDEPYNPEATVSRVSRKAGGGSDNAQEEPDERSRVRIRTTVALCTQPNVLMQGNRAVPILPLDERSPYKAIGEYKYPAGNFKFDYCRSPTGVAESGGT